MKYNPTNLPTFLDPCVHVAISHEFAYFLDPSIYVVTLYEIVGGGDFYQSREWFRSLNHNKKQKWYNWNLHI